MIRRLFGILYIPFIILTSLSARCQDDLFFKHKNAPGTDSLVKKFRTFLGKEVYNFLLDDSIRNYRRFYLVMEPPGALHCGSIIYKNGDEICVYADKLKYLNRYSDSGWDKALFYRETITSIVYLKNGTTFYFGVYSDD
jgi:hypothetical protein